jgi:hypothetical protein
LLHLRQAVGQLLQALAQLMRCLLLFAGPLLLVVCAGGLLLRGMLCLCCGCL